MNHLQLSLTLNQNVGCVLGRSKERQKIWFLVQLTFLTLLTFIVTFWLYKAWNSPFPYPPNLETNSSKSKTGPIQTGSSYTRVGKSAPEKMQIHGTQDLAHRSLGLGKVWEAWLSPAHPSALSWDITSSPKLIGPPKLDSAPFVCLLVVWTQPYHCTYHSWWLCSITRQEWWLDHTCQCLSHTQQCLADDSYSAYCLEWMGEYIKKVIKNAFFLLIFLLFSNDFLWVMRTSIIAMVLYTQGKCKEKRLGALQLLSTSSIPLLKWTHFDSLQTLGGVLHFIVDRIRLRKVK